jgi:hypothetical protein
MLADKLPIQVYRQNIGKAQPIDLISHCLRFCSYRQSATPSRHFPGKRFQLYQYIKYEKFRLYS